MKTITSSKIKISSESKTKIKSKSSDSIYAVIRIRGTVNVRKKIKKTLNLLRLNRVNHCVLVPKNEYFIGMLKIVKDYVTFGEINEKTLNELVKKRGRMIGNKKLDETKAKNIATEILKNKSMKNIKDFKPVFRLNPPIKGFKAIKKHYPKGDLGNRGEKINELLERMI